MSEKTTMNIYQKINAVRYAILQRVIGKDKKAFNYNYIDLPQIESAVIEECNKVGLITLLTFVEGCAVMKVIDTDNPEIQTGVTSPICDASMVSIKGAQAIQNVGGMMTYMRRYLYMQVFAISEHDVVEGVGKLEQESAKGQATLNVEPKINEQADRERAEILKKYDENLPNYLPKLVAHYKVNSVDDIPTETLKSVFATKMKHLQKTETKEQKDEQGNLL